MSIFPRLKNAFLNLLFPQACVRCATEGTLLCRTCEDSLRLLPPSCFVCGGLVPAGVRTPAGRTCNSCRDGSHIYAFFSPFTYGNPVIREMIHGLKYRYATSLAPILGRLLSDSLVYMRSSVPSESVVIPIPLSPSRQRVRGFNQSEVIGRYVSRFFSLPLVCGVLVKIKETKPQMEIYRDERLINMKGAFAVAKKEIVENKTVILIDDVKTTGATLEEAARVLKEAGVKEVWAITIAH